MTKLAVMKKKSPQTRRASTLPRDQFLTGVRFLDIHLYNAPAGHVPSHRIDEPGELIIMLKGIYRAKPDRPADALPFEAKAGDVICWPPGTNRREVRDPQLSIKCFAIYFDWSQPSRDLPFVLRDHHGIIRTLAERLLAVHASPLGIPWTVRDAYLAGILAEYQHLAAAILEKSLVGQVTRYIEDHLAEPFRLTDLARHIGFDKAHFTRKFKSLTRQTPMRYVRHQRALRALGILTLHPTRSLKRIAAYIGVSDELQVRRLLQQYCKVSVRELRKMKSVYQHVRVHPDPIDPPVKPA